MLAPQTNVVRIETLPQMQVACLRVVSETPEQDGRARMNQWKDSLHLTAACREFGFDVEVSPEDEKAGRRGYEVWMTVPDQLQVSEGIPEGFRVQAFPGGLYAALILDRCFEAPFERIPAGWKDLHDWVIHAEGYQSAGHQWLEEVLPMNYGETLKLYHPVMPSI